MKTIFTSLLLFISVISFGQKEVLDLVNKARKEPLADGGKSNCTEGYWNAEHDSGKKFFKRVQRMGEDVELVVAKESKGKNRVVYTIDFMRDGKKRDEVYLYVVKVKKKWLMDGFNESEHLIPHFVDGTFSGHFSPTDLPSDAGLENIGKDIAALDKNMDAMSAYLKKIVTDDSDLYFLRQLSGDDYEQHEFMKAGYSEKLKKGYIYWKGKRKNSTYSYSEITIHITKVESGKYKITGAIYGWPSARSFFRD